MVEGIAERFELTIVARRIAGGVEISQPPDARFEFSVGSAGRVRFAAFVARYLAANRGKFDYVVAQGYGLAAFAANAASRILRLPSAMMVCSPTEVYYKCRVHDPSSEKPYRASEFAALEAFARLNARIGRRYIAISRYLADTIRSHGANTRVDVIPVYGVDISKYHPSHDSKESLRAKRSLPESGKVVFFSSRIAPEKDSHTLLAAFGIVLARQRDLWLLHRSGGYGGFRREAERRGLANRVIATDAVHPHHELPLDYQASDLCVQASREEGLGFSPLEAMACGVPVIASAVGGLKETVIDNVTGWNYPVGDAAELANCIEAALDNSVEANRRATAGLAMVRERFERRTVFDKLEALIDSDVSHISSPTVG
jgi:glycosyltransferase involved in cell wall biosynthesis